ncbi:helix-turn-helix domain-containing protein [Vibrio parahaemolyticus]|uniref:helix-turn-helix domain-containing protein n=1 Tax=Vibrio parahaemolyticus TaxID=670 RepID=UPI00215B935F|nr:helix-turn-helix domain-containing protein [Vibrio parahaemolyticus]MCR9669420.1 helix-turn-helix domain-containing protein [Vibrio parahaemolyticus]MCR9826665.1 helix-turn-helix domain-containing protein [Vibrio parahaemolyticus]
MENTEKTMTKKEKSLNFGKNPEGIILERQIIPFKMRLKSIIGDMTVREFSRRCNLSDKTLRDYMLGNSYPTLDRLGLIAQASGKTLSWLATGEEPSDLTASNSVESQVKPAETSIPIDRELLQTSIEAIELLCEKKRLRMSPEKKAKVIALVYTISLEEKNVDESVIYQILDLAS